jgi:hypothetical protein
MPNPSYENRHKIYEVVRVDKDPTTNQIIDKIFVELVEADFVIANLTPNKTPYLKQFDKFFNSNVMYELALRHSLNLPTIHFIEHAYINELLFRNQVLQEISKLRFSCAKVSNA